MLNQRSAASSVSFSYAIDGWMRTSEIEASTRKTYLGYIGNHIKPVLGKIAGKKIDVRTLESFYTELRRCRVRCDGRPFVVHKRADEHDCAGLDCQPHKCKELAASTVQQIHSIISGTLAAAERWDWINSNPARLTRRPRRRPPEPDPPTTAEAGRIVDEAFRLDDDWGTLVWLAMTTGMRRGELCGLRFARVDLDAEVIDLRRNWVLGEEKDTKTHQNRRIALDSETVTLLREHRARVGARLAELGIPFSEDLFVFSNARTPDHSVPYSPNAVTQRYKDMATRLGIKTHLRHAAAARDIIRKAAYPEETLLAQTLIAAIEELLRRHETGADRGAPGVPRPRCTWPSVEQGAAQPVRARTAELSESSTSNKPLSRVLPLVASPNRRECSLFTPHVVGRVETQEGAGRGRRTRRRQLDSPIWGNTTIW